MTITSTKTRVSLWAGGCVAVVAALLTGVVVWAGPAHDSPTQASPTVNTAARQNLLAGTFGYMPGATVAAGGALHIRHTGLTVLAFPDDTHPGESDTDTDTEHIPNPPINTYGTHITLGTADTFSVEATLTDIRGGATLSLYSHPTIRYDERLTRLPSIDVHLDDGVATVTSYGQPGTDSSHDTFGYERRSGGAATVRVTKYGSRLFVDIDGDSHRVSGGNTAVFPQSVWVGMDSTQSFTVSSLTATPLPGSSLTLTDTSKAGYINARRSDNGLISRADKAGNTGKLVGTAVDLPVLMADPAYANFIVENFNEIETEMLAKFQAVQPEEGNFQFAELDALVDFASTHGLTVHGHTLAFGEAYPAWLENKLANGDRTQAIRLLQNHIRTVVTRYDGKHGHGLIPYWDVVNEPFSADATGQLSTYNIWHKALGKDYMPIALDAARSAFPGGIFGVNENALEADPDRRAGMRTLINDLNKDTHRVDFVGFQAHFDESTLRDDQAMQELFDGVVDREFSYYASRGVKVRFSEVTVAGIGDENSKPQVYGLLSRECVQAANCLGVNLWGATNNTGLYFYNTGDYEKKDPGNDAPTTQEGTGEIQTGSAYDAMVEAFTQPH